MTTIREITLNTYNVTLRYEDRKTDSEGRTIKVDASSIAGAIGKATREFVKSLDRKQRFDMNKGLKIEALRVTTDKEEVTHPPLQPGASEGQINSTRTVVALRHSQPRGKAQRKFSWLSSDHQCAVIAKSHTKKRYALAPAMAFQVRISPSVSRAMRKETRKEIAQSVRPVSPT
jgi:hypothetical protein